MLVKEILDSISKREQVSSYRDIPVQKYMEFQVDKTIKEHINFKEDIDFE